MDRKTLEYMEERTKKAREIVKKIEKLKKNIEDTSKVRVVRFLNNNWNTEFDSSTGDLTDLLKVAYIKVANEEIELLEQELAEI